MTTNPFSEITDRLTNIECMLHDIATAKPSPTIQPDSDRWFDINELSEYIPDKPARATIYTWVQHSHIPYHKGKKKLRFLKSEIDQWLKLGRRQTVSEVAADADNFLNATHK